MFPLTGNASAIRPPRAGRWPEAGPRVAAKISRNIARSTTFVDMISRRARLAQLEVRAWTRSEPDARGRWFRPERAQAARGRAYARARSATPSARRRRRRSSDAQLKRAALDEVPEVRARPDGREPRRASRSIAARFCEGFFLDAGELEKLFLQKDAGRAPELHAAACWASEPAASPGRAAEGAARAVPDRRQQPARLLGRPRRCRATAGMRGRAPGGRVLPRARRPRHRSSSTARPFRPGPRATRSWGRSRCASRRRARTPTRVIREIVDAAARPAELLVVTSDKALYSYAHTRGASVLRAHEWNALARGAGLAARSAAAPSRSAPSEKARSRDRHRGLAEALLARVARQRQIRVAARQSALTPATSLTVQPRCERRATRLASNRVDASGPGARRPSALKSRVATKDFAHEPAAGTARCLCACRRAAARRPESRKGETAIRAPGRLGRESEGGPRGRSDAVAGAPPRGAKTTPTPFFPRRNPMTLRRIVATAAGPRDGRPAWSPARAVAARQARPHRARSTSTPPASSSSPTLPGVGPKLAARIVEYRQKSGSFRSTQELHERAGHRREELRQARALAEPSARPRRRPRRSRSSKGRPALPGRPARSSAMRARGFSLVEMVVVVGHRPHDGGRRTAGVPADVRRGTPGRRRRGVPHAVPTRRLDRGARRTSYTAIRFETRGERGLVRGLSRTATRTAFAPPTSRRASDSLISGPFPLTSGAPDVRVGINPGVPAIPPDSGLLSGDPIRFGRSDTLSFSPLGTATPGTFYLAGDSAQAAVRVTRWQRPRPPHDLPRRASGTSGSTRAPRGPSDSAVPTSRTHSGLRRGVRVADAGWEARAAARAGFTPARAAGGVRGADAGPPE